MEEGYTQRTTKRQCLESSEMIAVDMAQETRQRRAKEGNRAEEINYICILSASDQAHTGNASLLLVLA